MFNKPLSIALAAAWVLTATGTASALDFGDLSFQPRVETGVSNYDYKEGGYNKESSILYSTGTMENISNSQGSFKVDTNMGFLGGGFTVFSGPLFFDVSGRKYFTGNGKISGWTGSSSDNKVNPGGGVAGYDTVYSENANVDVKRDEYALSLGYTITPQLVLFGGWKWANSQFNLKNIASSASEVCYNAGSICPGGASFNTYMFNETGNETYKFDYNGPFLGATYGLSFPEANGGLSFKFAVADLDDKLKDAQYNLQRTYTYYNGSAVNITVPVSSTYGSQNGNTIGFSYGIAWHGDTPVKGLSYAVGTDLYQYSFKIKSSNMNVDERVINFTLGASYAF